MKSNNWTPEELKEALLTNSKINFSISNISINSELVKKGELFTENMFTLLAPGKGLLQNELSKFIGKEIKLFIKKNACISKKNH